MKKKLLSTLLCAAMAVSMLAGCGGSDSNAAADNSTASDATERLLQVRTIRHQEKM